jgi:uncharacterized membrane protein
MNKNRTEAFSDGVIAIIITIMVLELKPPATSRIEELGELAPVLARYLLSFVYVGIYWVNHHALLGRVRSIDGAALWANLHLLFWMSLIPYVTAWAGEFPMEALPVALYGVILMMCALSFMLLSWRLDVGNARTASVEERRKNGVSVLLYAVAVGLSFVYPPLGAAVHAGLALLWIRP